MFITSFHRVVVQAQTAVVNQTRIAFNNVSMAESKRVYERQMSEFSQWCKDNVADSVNTAPVFDVLRMRNKRAQVNWLREIDLAEAELARIYRAAQK